MLKYLDKLLKILKTDRNTFFTYLFMLFTIYIVIDRLVEVLFLIFTGIGISYWGPITYTLALSCPVFAFLFSGCSIYARSGKMKITMVYMYAIALYIIAISMFSQWLNAGLWLAFLSLPNYVEIVTKFTSLIKPAFQAIALYLPLTTFFSLFWWCYTKIADTRLLQESIWDYTGLDLSKKKVLHGAYSLENTISIDKETGKPVRIVESRRADAMLVCGPSGMGKTALLLEPMMARDMEKKYFLKEAAKEVGFTALKTGLANINCPYTNEYINKNFNLNMLEPISGKEKLYKAYLSKLIYCESPKIVYKDLGITFLSPDYESTNRMVDVARNFNLKVNIVDPSNPDTMGINPFSYGEEGEVAGVISSILSTMYSSSRPAEDEVYFQNSASQAVENLAIILKEMYPRLNNGLLPNLEDMINMLNDFNLVEDLCKKIEDDPELADKHRLQLGYFKKYFYREGSMREQTEKYVHTAITQIDGLLRIPNLRNILCNRTNNINFDKALANGEVTIVCTRRGDLGGKFQKVFGLFFLLSMQRSVIKRPGSEATRIPHLLYIDDAYDFICPATMSMFTLYRKYKVGTIVTAQNLNQLDATSSSRKTIVSNCISKIIFGSLSPEEVKYWADEFGNKRDWLYSRDMTMKAEPGGELWGDESTVKSVSYGDFKGVKWGWKPNFELGKLQGMKFKDCAFKMKDDKGKNFVGVAVLDFMSSKYKEPHKEKKFDFTKFTTGIVNESPKTTKRKFNPKQIDFDNFDDDNDIEPIQTDVTDASALFNNEDAIVYDIHKNNSGMN